jgi:hypothetical protein
MNFPEIPTSLNDPIFQSLVRRKQQGEDTTLPPIQEFPQQDIEELESFCRKYGIIGFNCGRMNPKSALRMLKSRMGVPIEEATPAKIKSLLKG